MKPLRLRRALFFTWIVATTATASAQSVDAPRPPSSTFALASQKAIAEMDVRIAQIDKEIADARKELEGIAPTRTRIDARVHARGRLLYRLVRAGLMPLSGGFRSFVDHAQRVEGLKRSLHNDLTEANRLAGRGGELATKLDALTKERADLVDKKNLAEAAKVAIDDEKRRNEAFERAFATSVGATSPAVQPTTPSDEIMVYGPSGKATAEEAASTSFRARKGRLVFPIAGKAEIHRVTKEGGPALEIVAPAGTPVRAVHAARVAFAEKYGSYGALVILDHGNRYYTVSGNLGSIEVKVGDEVSAGSTIGTVGDDGTGAKVTFELRLGNDKVSPETWFGL